MTLSLAAWLERVVVAELAEAGGLQCRGSGLWVEMSALQPLGVGSVVGGRGVLSRHSARACCYLHPAEACPGPAFPEPQAAGLGGGGLCPPLFWQEPSVRFPHPVGLRQAQARGVRLGLPQGPRHRGMRPLP